MSYEDCYIWLAHFLGARRLRPNGEDYRVVKSIAKTMGFTTGQLKAARRELGIVTRKARDTWYWELPKKGERP